MNSLEYQWKPNFIQISLCLRLFVCLWLATSIIILIVWIDLRTWIDVRNMVNLSNYVRDRQLLGYDLDISGLLKPPTVRTHLRD